MRIFREVYVCEIASEYVMRRVMGNSQNLFSTRCQIHLSMITERSALLALSGFV